MALTTWPCIPDSFASIFPGDLPYFLQTGSANVLRRGVSIIDPSISDRIDPVDRFDHYQSFCKCLRGGCLNLATSQSGDRSCRKCDLLVAQQLIRDNPEQILNTLSDPIHYRCYMGLEEMAAPIWVGGIAVMVFSGQILPPEGLGDIWTAIECLGIRPPSQAELSSAMWNSLSRFRYPEMLWTEVRISEEARLHLLSHAEELSPCENGFPSRFLTEARRIESLAQSYYDIAKAKVEVSIMQDIVRSTSEAALRVPHHLWEAVRDVLEVFRRGLNLQYVAFFVGRSEGDTILELKATAGDLPFLGDGDAIPHFNWRKAGLRTEDARDSLRQTREWDSVTITESPAIALGFRGGTNPFTPPNACIPSRLLGGARSLLVLGPNLEGASLTDYESFVLSASRDLASRILTLHLAQILDIERTDWANTAKLLGHQVRSSVHSIGSQLNVIRAERERKPGFTEADRMQAEKNLETAFIDLTEVSYAAESSVPGKSVKVNRRELVGVDEIIHAAVANQQEIADENDVVIEVDDSLEDLPRIYANPTLMRIAFINLINNGLKYSNPYPQNRKRVLKIHPPNTLPDPGEIRVEVVNFGVGIKDTNRQRIFEWGTRLAIATPTFRETHGKGIGLWETRRIIEGHGGHIYVDSLHYSKAPVTDGNIEECITIFTVCLPIG